MWVLAALGTPLGGGVGEGKWEGKALWNFPRTEYIALWSLCSPFTNENCAQRRRPVEHKEDSSPRLPHSFLRTHIVSTLCENPQDKSVSVTGLGECSDSLPNPVTSETPGTGFLLVQSTKIFSTSLGVSP